MNKQTIYRLLFELVVIGLIGTVIYLCCISIPRDIESRVQENNTLKLRTIILPEDINITASGQLLRVSRVTEDSIIIDYDDSNYITE